MKRIFAALAIGATLVTATACNNSQDMALENARLQHYKDSVKLASDTAGFSQYQAWKSQNELMQQQQYNGQQGYAAAPNAVPTRTIVKYYPVKSSSSGRRSSSSSNGAYSRGSGSTASTGTAKKGWSKAAKGAVIGGVGGAAAGAIINKRNRAAGAVIGGILGAGVGYGIGRGQDKKDGRY